MAVLGGLPRLFPLLGVAMYFLSVLSLQGTAIIVHHFFLAEQARHLLE
jgi:hypothetical protein